MATEPQPTNSPPSPGGPAGASGTPPARRAPRRPPPSPLAVITGVLGLFFVVLTLLALQMRNGRDPALGTGPAVPAQSQPQSSAGAAQQATKVVTRTSPVPP